MTQPADLKTDLQAGFLPESPLVATDTKPGLFLDKSPPRSVSADVVPPRMLVQLGPSGVCQRQKLCVETLHTHSSSVRVHGLLGNLPMSCGMTSRSHAADLSYIAGFAPQFASGRC